MARIIIIEISDEYCIGLIKAALGHSHNSNINIETSNIKKRILMKLNVLKDTYGLTHEEIFSEISFNFLRKSIRERKIDLNKGSATTFILWYVFNELRNIEDKCKRGTFMKTNQKHDAMDLVAEDFMEFIGEEFTNKIEDGVEYDNPESILIMKETFEALKNFFTEDDLNEILNSNISDRLRKKIEKFKNEAIE